MTSSLAAIILQVIERAPQWIRRGLEAKDNVARIQAEETLAAMIADAVAKQGPVHLSGTERQGSSSGAS